MAPQILLQQLASGVGVLAGAFMVKSLLDSQNNSHVSSAFPRCPTCNGTRRVPCLCNRWSDGDVGCRSCGGTGMSVCNSCGGSGTGRPLPVSIRPSSVPRSSQSPPS
ncbi:hypothetical protein GOP47_0008345 [Adiantum capillus-veneris]|uniref:Uncharacterized protein n=1 Tax=Adiantum capillus-veneris TaxID=13818 RepID=A0A9D4UYR4_ADICA|nr:hypothetical protein GOP47_0008345 [Adiantum capillus-veneris]